MFPSVCGRFALGTFSKTYFKDVVVEINMFITNKNTKSMNVSFDTKINKCIITRNYVVSINTFRYTSNQLG